MHDRKLDAPLSSLTCLGSYGAIFASNPYALAISNMCDEEELVTFNESQNLENWMATMQCEYDAIMENGT